jgi:hypothetical protein
MLGGADVSWIIGFCAASLLYYIVARTTGLGATADDETSATPVLS